MIKINITDVKIRKTSEEGKMKAVVSITFDNKFVIHDIKIIESKDKLFVAMPSRKVQDGEYKDIAHPINSEMRNVLQNEIIEKYKDYIKNQET